MEKAQNITNCKSKLTVFLCYNFIVGGVDMKKVFGVLILIVLIALGAVVGFDQMGNPIIDLDAIFDSEIEENNEEPVEVVSEVILIISEYTEGSSNNKAIELANLGNASADLSNYRLAFYYNDSMEPDYVDLEGSLEPNDVYVITHTSFDESFVDFEDKMGLRQNGDDEFSLEELVDDSWVEIDVFGLVTERGLENSWAQDQTFVRNYNITEGSKSFNVNEWTIYEVDYFADLGNHSTSGNDTVAPVVEINNSISRVLTIGSEAPNYLDYFIVVDNIDGEIVIDETHINGEELVDMNVQGLYEIELIVTDESGNTSTTTLTLRVYDPKSTELVLTPYYESVEGLTGEELKLALNELIDEHTVYSYDEVWDILKESDQDPSEADNVLLLYTGLSYPKECQDAGAYSTCEDVWNREHVWSKSRGDFGIVDGPGTDLHHLRAADKVMNSTRNNRLFDICDIEVGYGNDKCDYWAFEPRDEVKGDVARMLFYMVVRYEGYDEYLDLELNEELLDKDSIEPFHGKLSLLLEWNLLDPVDDFERQRNEVIFGYQRNRNPFIDYPEFANMIFN